MRVGNAVIELLFSSECVSCNTFWVRKRKLLNVTRNEMKDDEDDDAEHPFYLKSGTRHSAIFKIKERLYYLFYLLF